MVLASGSSFPMEKNVLVTVQTTYSRYSYNPDVYNLTIQLALLSLLFIALGLSATNVAHYV